MNWPAILKTALLGTERATLPENVATELQKLGLTKPENPSEALLEALAAANLLKKAATKLEQRERPETPQLIESEELTPCPTPAVEAVELMLAGVHAEALPEFLQLLSEKKKTLPPETLPGILNRSERDPNFFQKIKPALGPRAEWLALQNPTWRGLFVKPKPDWQTGGFQERVKMLAEARANAPIVGTAWLEKTWDSERPEHKTQFLRLLRTGLSNLDENLLERALRDKSREPRLVAAQLLCLFPSAWRGQLLVFFGERFPTGIPGGEMADSLKAKLPDFEDETCQRMLSLLPGKEFANDWRSAVYGLFWRLLPPVEMEKIRGLAPEIFLEKLTEPGSGASFLLPAVLDAVAFHEDEKWQSATLSFFSKMPENPIWASQWMFDFLESLPENRWQAEMEKLVKTEGLLALEKSAVLRSLAENENPWPQALLHGFLAQLDKLAIGRSVWSLPGDLIRSALKNAGYRCSVAGAEAARAWLLPSPEHQHVWKRELNQFFDTVRFRGKWREFWA